jgi:hypothetical protein
MRSSSKQGNRKSGTQHPAFGSPRGNKRRKFSAFFWKLENQRRKIYGDKAMFAEGKRYVIKADRKKVKEAYG